MHVETTGLHFQTDIKSTHLTRSQSLQMLFDFVNRIHAAPRNECVPQPGCRCLGFLRQV